MKMRTEKPNPQEQEEIEQAEKLLTDLFDGRAFILIYERENGKSASVQHPDLTAGEVITALRNIADFIECLARDNLCQKPQKPDYEDN